MLMFSTKGGERLIEDMLVGVADGMLACDLDADFPVLQVGHFFPRVT